MGLKDQFQDKAKQLADKAKAKDQAQDAASRASDRSRQAGQETKAQADRAQDVFDSPFED